MTGRVVIFGGTTEGRMLAEDLAAGKIQSIYLAATEYGKQTVKSTEYIDIRAKRLNSKQMAELFLDEKPVAIIDATHPFAAEVKKEIDKAVLEYKEAAFFRIRRDEEGIDYTNCTFFDNASDCAKALEDTNGKVFLTTGSKDIGVFCKNPKLRKRLVVRLIPSVEGLEQCYENGLLGDQLIAMQGPFSTEMNLAFIKEAKARIVVLKESGKAGGEAERITAANRAGVPCFIIRRPKGENEGESFTAVESKLFSMLGNNASNAPVCEGFSHISVTIAGFGMGQGSLTEEVNTAIAEADYIFAAQRILAQLESDATRYPHYLADDILNKLRELERSARDKAKALVLFSGDTGFYSGAKRLIKALADCGVRVSVLPGISSISALSAKVGQAWQDAYLLSTHGRPKDDWLPSISFKAREYEKLFVLTSKADDVRLIGQELHLIEKNSDCSFQIIAGINLYDDERLSSLNSKECAAFDEDGLTTLFIKNSKPVKKRLVPGLPDSAFNRSSVPMSKEEIRAISICKLGISQSAICYDIGSGSGSIAVELALLDESIRVYAIEMREEACALINENIAKFNLKNVRLICGQAPAAMDGLPAPTHVFIGGSGKQLEGIIVKLKAYKRPIRVVINSVTMETISEINELIKKYDIKNADIALITAGKAKRAGDYNVMQGQNPVYIVTFDLD